MYEFFPEDIAKNCSYYLPHSDMLNLKATSKYYY